MINILNKFNTITHYIKIIIYVLIALLLISSFSLAIYQYFNMTINDKILSHSYDKHYYGDSDSVIFDINSINSGKFFGKITVYIKSQENKKNIKDGERFYIRNFSLNNAQHGELFEVKLVKINEYVSVFESDKDILLYSLIYYSKYFPFDEYPILFSPKFVITDKYASIIYEDKLQSGKIKLNIPISYASYVNFDEEYNHYKICGESILIDVKRHKWFICLFFGISTFLVLPVLILIESKVESVSFDIIALVLSFVSIRSFLVSETKSVYIIDIFFCILVLISGLIIIFKLSLREFKRKITIKHDDISFS